MVDRLIVFGYLVVLVAIGLRGGQTVRNASDFSAADKRYGTFVIFASLSASFIGGGYSSGNAAAAFEQGIGTALAGWLLAFSGYVGGAEVQSASTLTMLHIMYLWIPMCINLVITLILSRMNVEHAVETERAAHHAAAAAGCTGTR
jgi:hypothetical protein